MLDCDEQRAACFVLTWFLWCVFHRNARIVNNRHREIKYIKCLGTIGSRLFTETIKALLTHRPPITGAELENTICFCTYRLQWSPHAFWLTHSSFPSLKNEREAVLDCTRQTVLGDRLWYRTLFIGRAGVHHINPPNRHKHYLLRGPAAVLRHEHTGRLPMQRETQSDIFFFRCRVFLEARCEEKAKSSLQIMCGERVVGQ